MNIYNAFPSKTESLQGLKETTIEIKWYFFFVYVLNKFNKEDSPTITKNLNSVLENYVLKRI